jgi:mono/diheme cytochrome c family protein
VRHVILLTSILAGAATYAQELPAGPGRDEVMRRCIACHETDMIAQQRLSPAAWGREVDKMTGWGAGVEAAERDAIIAYLARHFAPAQVVSQPDPAAVPDATYTRACLVCHERDLVEAQRLGRPAWTREVEKMMRWGAGVSDTEKAALIEYLAGRFPAR